MGSLTVKVGDTKKKLKLSRFTLKAVPQLIEDLAAEPDGPLVLTIHGLAGWSEESQRALWTLWQTVKSQRSLKLRANGTVHANPLDLVLEQLAGNDDPEVCARRLRAATLAVALCYSPETRSHCAGKLLKRLKALGVGDVTRKKLEQMVLACATPAPPATTAAANPTLLAADFLARFRAKVAPDSLDPGARVLHYHGGTFYAWDRVWRSIVQDEMRALAVKDLQDHGGVEKVTTSLANNVLLNLQGLCLVGRGDEPLPFYINEYGPPTEIARRQLLVLQNGMLDLGELASGEPPTLLDFDPRWFGTSVLPFAYDAKAKCPKFGKFLSRVLERDPETKQPFQPGDQRLRVLQEWFGYTLLCDGRFQKFLLMIGEGSNGKGVLQNLWIRMLGGDNVSHVSLDQLSGQFALQPLLGKLANICGDLSEIDAVAEGILKRLTGQDNLTVNRKNQTLITMAPLIKLIFATNTLPRFNDKSQGVWRRLTAMPFRVVIPDEEQKETLTQELEEELPGILNWALGGLRRLLQQGHFTHCVVCAEAARKHQFDCDPVAQFFDECVPLPPPSPGPVHRILKSVLYQQYAEWCHLNGCKPLSSNKFNRQVAKLPGIVSYRPPGAGPDSRRRYYWTGIGEPAPMPPPDDDEESEEDDEEEV